MLLLMVKTAVLGEPRVEPPVGWLRARLTVTEAGCLGRVGQNRDAEGLVELFRLEGQRAGGCRVVLAGDGGAVAGGVIHGHDRIRVAGSVHVDQGRSGRYIDRHGCRQELHRDRLRRDGIGEFRSVAGLDVGGRGCHPDVRRQADSMERMRWRHFRWPFVVTVVEPIERLSLAKAGGVGNQAGEELDQERSVGQCWPVFLEFELVVPPPTAVVRTG